VWGVKDFYKKAYKHTSELLQKSREANQQLQKQIEQIKREFKKL
jgi:hypothetical protein